MESPIRIEASTIEEARAQAESQLSPGFALTSETVEKPGKRTLLRATARTSEAALLKAREAVPEGATIVSEEVITEAEREVLTLEARSRALARRRVTRLLKGQQLLESVEVKIPPKRLVGIVREQGVYEATVLSAAEVELTYRTDFQMAFTVGPKAVYESVQTWGSFGPETGGFYYPVAIAADAQGNIYVTDNGFHLDEKGKHAGRMSRVQRFDGLGNWQQTLGEHGEAAGQLLSAQGLGVDGQGNVYVADGRGACVVKFSPEGEELARWGSKDADGGTFSGRTLRLAVSPDGAVYVSDQGKHCVHRFDAQGVYLGSWGSRGDSEGEFERPEGLALDAEGNVYVADGGNHRLAKFDSTGQLLAVWGSRGDEPGQFKVPRGIAVDEYGYVYVCGADTRVQKLDGEGNVIGQWGSEGKDPGQLDRPEDLAVDHLGRVYVLEYNNSRVQVFQ